MIETGSNPALAALAVAALVIGIEHDIDGDAFLLIAVMGDGRSLVCALKSKVGRRRPLHCQGSRHSRHLKLERDTARVGRLLISAKLRDIRWRSACKLGWTAR